ncbi:leucine carboxyl methyltransferase [Auricularia subglabra TFB-10046 SS5]|nr:leucine carboxyl methyltransferase [Auricularia subglabra TFB-10046 SS5]
MLPPPSSAARPDADAAIRATDSDAAQARISAVSKGYLHDAYAHHLVPRARFVPPRPPLINHGTHVRALSIDGLVHAWLSLGDGPKQILSVGAGSDSRYWRIAAGSHSKKLAKYVEMDLPENTSGKAMAIRKSRDLSAPILLGDPAQVAVTHGGQGLTAPRYALRPFDLRKDDLHQLVTDGLLDPALPTLLIAECVLVYISSEKSDALLSWASSTFSTCGAIVYEMFGLDDSFGRVMRENLIARHVSLPGVDTYPTLEAQARRFANNGFSTSANALSLKTIRSERISPDEKARIAQLEMLDEIEELELVLAHYAVGWGLKASPESPLASWSLPHELPASL